MKNLDAFRQPGDVIWNIGNLLRCQEPDAETNEGGILHGRPEFDLAEADDYSFHSTL